MLKYECPNCKNEIAFNQVFKEQYKKAMECPHCHAKFTFRMNKIIIIAVFLYSSSLPVDFSIRMLNFLIISILFFPITALWSGFVLVRNDVGKRE